MGSPGSAGPTRVACISVTSSGFLDKKPKDWKETLALRPGCSQGPRVEGHAVVERMTEQVLTSSSDRSGGVREGIEGGGGGARTVPTRWRGVLDSRWMNRAIAASGQVPCRLETALEEKIAFRPQVAQHLTARPVLLTGRQEGTRTWPSQASRPIWTGVGAETGEEPLVDGVVDGSSEDGGKAKGPMGKGKYGGEN